MDQKKIDAIGIEIENKLSEYIDDEIDKLILINFIINSIKGIRIEQPLHIYGSGGNGKSTFLIWMKDLLKENSVNVRYVTLNKLTSHTSVSGYQNQIQLMPRFDIGIYNEYDNNHWEESMNLRKFLDQVDRPNLIMMSNVKLPDDKQKIIQIEFSRTFGQML